MKCVTINIRFSSNFIQKIFMKLFMTKKKYSNPIEVIRIECIAFYLYYGNIHLYYKSTNYRYPNNSLLNSMLNKVYVLHAN